MIFIIFVYASGFTGDEFRKNTILDVIGVRARRPARRIVRLPTSPVRTETGAATGRPV